MKNHIEHSDYQIASEKLLSDYITYKLVSGEYERQVIKWLRMWIDNRDKNKSIIIRYEDLLNDTYKELQNILYLLDINYPEQDIRKIITKHDFERVSSRKPGNEDTKSFFRKGISNEWKKVFNHQQKLLFSKIGEDIITKLGYELSI